MKFRLLGAIAYRLAADATAAKKVDEAKRFGEEAYKHFQLADELGRKERRVLTKNMANLAIAAAGLGKYEEAENAYLKLLKDEPNDLLHYYNIAAIYSKWGKLDKALDYLKLGADHGLIDAGEFTLKELNEDPDFSNLRKASDSKIKGRLSDLMRKTR